MRHTWVRSGEGVLHGGTSENPPSTHSGELTLGTWLLQRPTHSEIMAPLSADTDSSAFQLHLKYPESSLSLPQPCLEYLQSAISLSPSSRSARRTSSTLRQYVYTVRDYRRG
jgi:hypothetical protein